MKKLSYGMIFCFGLWASPCDAWSFAKDIGQCLLSGDTSDSRFGFFAVYIIPTSMLYRLYKPVIAPAEVQTFLGANNSEEETGRNAVLHGPSVEREQMVYKSWPMGKRTVGVYQALPRVQQLLWDDLRQGADIQIDIAAKYGKPRRIQLANGDFNQHYTKFVRCVQTIQIRQP